MKVYLKFTLLLSISALCIAIIILASVPPISKDALTHHLAVPKLYLAHGGIYEIPSVTFSYYPMNLDLLYLFPLLIGKDIIPKYIHFSFALFTAFLIFSYLKQRLNVLFALLGVLFFLSVPIIIKLSITVYVDLGLIFFSTASLIYLLKWIEAPYRIIFFIVAGICCGIALGTKYNGLITLLILAFFIPILYVRCSVLNKRIPNKINNTHVWIGRTIKVQYKAVGYGLLFVFIALLIFSPWMIRNIKWTKNPIYPLFNNLFVNNLSEKKPELDLKKEKTKRKSTPKSGILQGPFAVRKNIYKETWWQITLIPIRVFFCGKDGSPATFDGKLNPLLCILPFFAFFGIKGDSRPVKIEKYVFLMFSLLYFIFVLFLIDMRIRWISPIIPPLVILSIFGLHRIFSNRLNLTSHNGKIVCSVFVFVLISGMLVINLKYIVEQFNYVDPFSYISGQLNRDEYIEKFRPEYPAIQYANRNLSTEAKIYCIFLGMRRYYSDRELIFFSVSDFSRIIKNADSSKSILSSMKSKSVTHILVGLDLLDNWSFKSLNAGDREMLTRFFHKHTQLLFSNGKYALFKCIYEM